MNIFLQPRITSLPPPVQAVVVHNVIKLYSRVYLKAENDVIITLNTVILYTISSVIKFSDVQTNIYVERSRIY